jgi:hypothetical protein
MLANALTDYVKTLGIVPATFAVRAGRIEATARLAVMVMFPLGGYNDTLDQAGFYSGNQQLIIRSPDPMQAYALSTELQTALTVLGEAVDLDGYSVKFMRPRGLPIIYPINDADLYESSLNFSIRATVQ